MLLKHLFPPAWIALGALAVSFGQTAPQVWTVPNYVRVSQTQTPTGTAEVSLSAAKGEYEPFQIVVTAPSTGLSNVNLSASDLVGPSGAVISQTNLTFYREHYVNVTQPSPDYGAGNRSQGAGWYPDGLIPFKGANGADLTGTLDAVPFTLSSNKNQPIWVDLYVPQTAVAGTYTGTVTVTSTQGTATVKVTLQVWNFSLPLKPTLKSSFGLHGAQFTKANDQVLLQHKIMPVLVDAKDSADLSARFGLNASALPIYIGSNNQTCTMTAAPSVSSVQSAMSGFASGVQTYVYMADEIERCPSVYETMKSWARNVHQAGSKTLVTISPQPSLYDDGSGTGRSAVDIWVVGPALFPSLGTRVADVQAKGDEVWSYTALIPDLYTPKWLLDFAPINYRIFPGFLNQTNKLTGTLYWAVDSWSSDPWNNPTTLLDGQYMIPGEGMLVYPGTQVGLTTVVPSMRLKWIREGVEDYEYITILTALGRRDWAMQLVQTVATDWTHWNSNPDLLENVRKQLGAEIHRLGGGTSTPVIDNTPPAISSVAAGQVTTSSAAITWTTNEASTTQVEYGTTSAYGALSSLDSSLLTSHSVTISGLSAGTIYYFRVISKDAAGNSATATGSFTTTAASSSTTLAAPVNLTPANQATGVSKKPTFSWTASSGATSYQFWAGRSRYTISYVATVTGTSYTHPSTLASGATYYWKVVAKNSTSSATSATWSFVTTR